MTDHKFGGHWTEVKLDVLEKYLSFYTKALKNITNRYDWKLIYIDAFAGTGECHVKSKSDPIAGSAKIALNTNPPFDEYYFIEKNYNHIAELQDLCNKYPDKITHVYNDDANKKVADICRNINWKKNRAVMFLDPYGMEVKWPILEEIANTKAIDLWYLFPLSGLYRQAARDSRSLDKSKEKILDELLGTTEWRTAFYEVPSQSDLFESAPAKVRTAEWDDLLKYVREKRLKTIFAEVSQPLILPRTGVPRFALYFAVSNPSAVGLSMKVASYILKAK